MPYIVLDGMDGVGKGTVIEAVQQNFPNFIFTREPGGTDLGERIRGLFLGEPMQEATEIFLLLAQRVESRKLVSDFLSQGKVVFSDRSDSATFAYQIIGRQQPHLERLFWETRKYLPPEPNVYIFLDTDPAVAVARTGRRATDDRFDSAGVEFFARVRDGFHQFSKKAGTTCHFVDATPPKEVVAAEVVNLLSQMI